MEKNIKEIWCSNLREAGKLTVLTGTHARAKINFIMVCYYPCTVYPCTVVAYS
jgi:hypothetical protein